MSSDHHKVNWTGMLREHFRIFRMGSITHKLQRIFSLGIVLNLARLRSQVARLSPQVARLRSQVARLLSSSSTTQISSSTTGGPTTGLCVSGTIDCVGGQFAQCVNGQYILTSCGSGTTCTKIDIGGGDFVITCAYPTSKKLARNHAKRRGFGRRHALIEPAHKE